MSELKFKQFLTENQQLNEATQQFSYKGGTGTPACKIQLENGGSILYIKVGDEQTHLRGTDLENFKKTFKIS